MNFKGFSSKFVCYGILVFPFVVLLVQILGLYIIQPFEGVAQELGFIALNCSFLIFISTIAYFLKPSIFWQGPFVDTLNYRNIWIAPVIASIAAFASLYNAYEIYDQYGLPLIVISNGEELRLAEPLNKYINLLQSLWFVALPLVILAKNNIFKWFLIISVIIYSVYIGNRGAILFLIFMIGIRMQFSLWRAILIVSIGSVLILAKSFQLNISMMDYFLVLSTSQAEILNSYINAKPDIYWGWFTYIRLFGPLIPGDQLALIDLQNILLNIQFDGLFVASAYIYPYLDFGIYGVLFFQYLNYFLALLALRKFQYYPTTCSLVLFALVISFYDALFNQLFYLLLILVSLLCDLFIRRKSNHESFSTN